MATDYNQHPQITVDLGDHKITLLGTAHVSRASADRVRELIAGSEYDAVAVELCPSRYNAIVNPDSLAKMDLFKVFRTGKTSMVVATLALGAYQQRLAEQLGIEPGAEMRAAIEMAEAAKLPVLLIDREIGVTLKRIYRNVTWLEKLKLVAGLIAGVLSRHEVSEQEIERLKEGDMLESVFSEFAEQAHDLYVPLIAERDQYMAARLRQETAHSGHRHILAVIGAGHLQGIADHLQKAARSANDLIAELDHIPQPSKWPKLIPWLIVGLVFAGFFVGFSRSMNLGWQLVADWVLINGGLSALGAAFALGHPLTIVGAFIAAPITSLNPTIGAGMVTAAIEVFLRRPKVGDFSSLRSDTSRLRGWWRNSVSRTLLVFVFSTIGSVIGTYIAGFRIFERLVSG
ncbi:MAG: TraB/GumN family protein [Gammaproteobacteria bacterium]